MMKRNFTGLVLLVLLAGCGQSLPTELLSGTTATPTLTSTPQATATVTPTPTPSPIPTPTPTPQPDVLIAQANLALSRGDYEGAAPLYQMARLAALPPEEADKVTLGLAHTLLAQGDPMEAGQVISDYLVTAPDSARSGALHLALAQALEKGGDPAGAVEQYRAVVGYYPELAAYTHEWLGDALNAAGDPAGAQVAFQTALENAERLDQQVFLREKIGLALSAQQDYAGALAQYDAILSVAQIAGYRARIMYQAGQTARLAGDNEGATQRFYEIIQSYPDENYAYQALVALVEAGEPVDDLLRGKIDYQGEAYGPAVEALYRYIDANDDHTGEAHYYAGLSYMAAGSDDLALQEFERLFTGHPQDDYWGSALFRKAQTLASLNQIDKAVEAFKQLPDTLPAHPRAVEALQEAADLLEGVEDRKGAAAVWLDLADRYPAHGAAPDALFLAGLDWYQAGEKELALAAWQRLPQEYPASDRALGARFWMGKLQLMAGEMTSATATLQGVIDAAPGDYYALRAAELLTGQKPLSRPTVTPVQGCTLEDQQATEEWLASWLGITQTVGLGTLAPELAANPRLLRGKLLLELGEFDDGKTELEIVRESLTGDALSQYQLALFFRDIGLYRSSILAAARVRQLSPAGDVLQAPRFLGCLIYPTYFSDLVEKEAAEFKFDPLVLYALLRQESLFEGGATSYAAAHGLMQVIPDTGAQIAGALGWPPNYETPDLYRPMVSVRFGSWYLAQQRDRFDGALYPALAGYNGGPGNSAHWWEAAGKDTDLFVERIGFRETRLYVERITEHYARYRFLYELKK